MPPAKKRRKKVEPKSHGLTAAEVGSGDPSPAARELARAIQDDGGSALAKAGQKVIVKGKKIAAHMLEANDADIEFKSGAFEAMDMSTPQMISTLVRLTAARLSSSADRSRQAQVFKPTMFSATSSTTPQRAGDAIAPQTHPPADSSPWQPVPAEYC